MSAPSASAATPTTSHVHLSGLPSDLLDCYDNNLQALARHAGASDWSAPFARDWAFSVPAAGQLPRLAHEPVESRLRQDTGLVVTWRHYASGSAMTDDCRRLLQRGRPVLALADSYSMPWLPYYGRAHMTHSFIVDGLDPVARQVRVVDSYHNDTEWGRARPTSTTISFDDLAALLETGEAGYRVATLEPGSQPQLPDLRRVLLQNSEGILAAAAPGGDFARYVGYHRGRFECNDVTAVELLALACWLGQRSRACYARWLAKRADDDAFPPLRDVAARFETEIVPGWRRSAELAYLAVRRARRGRRPPTSALDELTAVAAREASAARQQRAVVHAHVGRPAPAGGHAEEQSTHSQEETVDATA